MAQRRERRSVPAPHEERQRERRQQVHEQDHDRAHRRALGIEADWVCRARVQPYSVGTHQIPMIPSPTPAISSNVFTGVWSVADVTERRREQARSATVEEHARLGVHGRDESGEHRDDSRDPRQHGHRAQVLVGHTQKRDRRAPDRGDVVVKAGDGGIGEEDEQGRADRNRYVQRSGDGAPGIAGLLGQRRPVFPADEHVQGKREARREAGQAASEVRPGERHARETHAGRRGRPRRRSSMIVTCARTAKPTAVVESLTPRAVSQIAPPVSTSVRGSQGGQRRCSGRASAPPCHPTS